MKGRSKLFLSVRLKTQRPHAIQLLHPAMTEIAAIIQYECLTLLARSIVCDRQMAREFAQCQPKTNAGLLKVQGPWIGQGADPVDLKGPTHVGKLMESLEPNYQIRHFLLGNNAVSTTGAKRVAEFIHKYPDRMETWYLAGCQPYHPTWPFSSRSTNDHFIYHHQSLVQTQSVRP